MALTDKLFAIGDAIRSKTGDTAGLTLDQMPAAIAGIQSGATFPNGTEWTLALSSDSFIYKDGSTLLHHDGVWVYARGEANSVLYSTDGKLWTSCNVDVNFGSPKLYYANGLWFISGSTNKVYYSTNGVNWSPSSLSGIGGSATIHYNDAIGWVAVIEKAAEYKNYIYHSGDGISWVSQTSFSHRSSAKSICWHNGRLLIGGGRDTFYTDSNFATVSSCGFRTHSLFKVGGGVFAVGVDGIYHTTDGATWSQKKNDEEGGYFAMEYANGVLVAGGLSGKYALVYSVDGGETWAENKGVSLVDPVDWLESAYSIHYENGVWVAATNSGIFTSRDGITWAATNIAIKTAKALYADGIWVAAGPGGLYYSLAWDR